MLYICCCLDRRDLNEAEKYYIMLYGFYDENFREMFSQKRTAISEDKNFFLPNLDEIQMTEQLIAPPAHIWDKIEKALDQQENRKKQGSEIIAATFYKKEKTVLSKYCFLAGGIGLLIGVLLIMM